MIFESVGSNEIGLYIDGSDFDPDLFQIGVMWLILKISGKWPLSNKLLSSLKRGKEIGVAIRAKNLLEIPQYDELDFLYLHRI